MTTGKRPSITDDMWERARQHHFMLGPGGSAKEWLVRKPPLQSVITSSGMLVELDEIAQKDMWDRVSDTLNLQERTFRQPKEKFVPNNRAARRRRK